MKRVFLISALLLLFSIGVIAEENTLEQYILFKCDDGATYEGISRYGRESIVVYGYECDEAPGHQADPSTCQHRYRLLPECKRIAWENAHIPVTFFGKHQQNAYYDVVCDLCGHKVEGVLLGKEYSVHDNVKIADVHMSEEQHLVIYQCKVCNQYIAEVIECALLQPIGYGTCYYDWAMHQ